MRDQISARKLSAHMTKHGWREVAFHFFGRSWRCDIFPAYSRSGAVDLERPIGLGSGPTQEDAFQAAKRVAVGAEG